MKSLYIHAENIHNTNAAKIVVPLILDIIPVKSVLDVGCGTGTWLRVFGDHSVNDYVGIDGEYVDPTQLYIDKSKFIPHDLTRPIDLQRKFDLVLSLEVAEHLPESAADTFVETLVRHGRVVVFSAAIPGQGGQNHLNEQWPAYWQEKFKSHGYLYYDLIRPKIWHNDGVDVWYRQNMFILFHESLEFDFPVYNNSDLIHPAYWLRIIEYRKHIDEWRNGNVGIANTWKAFKLSILNKLEWIFNR